MSDQETGAPREPLSIYAVLAVMVDQLGSIAWQKLGLQHDMVTGTIEMDLSQAKVAIDATASLAGFLEAELDETDRRQIQNLVRDLRMNFIEKSKEAGS